VTVQLADHVVIGAGIVGLATAEALQRATGGRALVLEMEGRLAPHQTGHNSGVLHSGLYYRPGSLKARLCTEGREARVRLCEEEGVAFERTGKLVVAVSNHERPALDELARRGEANGLEGIQRLEGLEALREVEPAVAGCAGLWIPQTGIVDYVGACRALQRRIEAAGGRVELQRRVTGLRREGGAWRIEAGGPVETPHLVNCAGAWSDRVARLAGLEPKVRIVPFRGEYHLLAPEAAGLVRGLIYPVPDPRFPFLGVHLTRMVTGEVEAGPNAVLALSRRGYRWTDVSLRDLASTLSYPGAWRLFARHAATGLGEVHRSLSRRAFARALRRLVPALRDEHLRPAGSGVRAQALGPDGKLLDDFAFERAPGALHVLCAPSPAATASLAIGEEIARVALEPLG
jgi:L-2-hydroxyglutarate oxidase